MFDSEHARPFVFGMNGTFSGTFIPQMIPLDAFASPASLELAAQPETPSALNLSQFVALRSELSVDDFIVAATPQHMGPSAHVLPDFLHFATAFTPHHVTLPSFDVFASAFSWDAPALPIPDQHYGDAPIVGAWFETRPIESLSWDLFLY
jgi:hypothetical protein